MIENLLANLAVVALGLVALTTASDWLERKAPSVRRTLFAGVMATGVVASMSMSVEIEGGLYFDLRSPLIVIAGLFGGWFVALPTALIACAYRLYLGGAVELGLVSIAIATFLGLVLRPFPENQGVRFPRLMFAAVLSAVGTPAVLLLLQSGQGVMPLGEIGVHSLVAFATVLFLGLVLTADAQRRRLARSNRQFIAMVDALPDCLNIKDEDGRFLAANPATARLMGALTSDQLIGKTDADFYPPDLAAQFRADEVEVMRRREPVVVEQFGVRGDGSEGWLSTLKAPAYDGRGRFIGLITSNRDITSKKRLQMELERMQGYFDQALTHMTDGLAIYDRMGTLAFANARYRELFPQTAHVRVPGNSFREIVSESVRRGEEPLPQGVAVEEHCDQRVASLFSEGDYLISIAGTRTYCSRTRILADGHSLRIISDVTDRADRESELENLALHDPLTKLPNRAYFEREFAKRLDSVQRREGQLVLMLIDLDWFKHVNDNHGHLVGDALLKEVASRMKATARRNDFVARLGGDEFAVLLSDAGEGKETDVAKRLLRAISKPMSADGVAIVPGATVGIALAEPDALTPLELIRRADEALYAAKAAGRGTWRRFGDREASQSQSA